MLAAIAFCVLLGLLVVFQLALVAGAPWGRFAWGGQHEGVLPARLRVGSVVSIVLYTLFGLIALDRSGVLVWLPAGVSQVAMWVVFAILALGTVMTALSRSKPERFVMTPVALVLAILALIIALG